MRTLLWLALVGMGAVVISSRNINFGPGLSVKNLFVYLPAAVLMINSVVGRPMKIGHRTIHACFAVLVGYAIVTTCVAALIVQYPQYKLLDSLLSLKAILVDWWVIFFVFSQCPRTEEDVDALMKGLLIVMSIANAATIGQLVGAIDLHREILCDEFGASSRVCGVFGHANETAILIAFFMPAYVAVTESASGMRKVFWIGCIAPSATMLILAASRSAIVGLAVGGIWAVVLCRRYLSMQRFIRWISVGAAVLVPMLIIVGVKYWNLMVGRWTEGSSVSAASMTSGRSDIWAGGLLKMLDSPWTFLTGFGWDSWSVMGFQYVAHNQYLSLEFELGLIGVATLVVILFKVTTEALAAAASARAHSNARRHMVGCVFAVLILAIAIFFGILYVPWSFIWMYVGLAMRYSVLISEARSLVPAARDARRPVSAGARLGGLPQ
jgi:O-antigen ligase